MADAQYVFLFVAKLPLNPQAVKPEEVPMMTYRWMVAGVDKDDAKRISIHHQIGLEETKSGKAQYVIRMIGTAAQGLPRGVLCVEKFVAQAALSEQHVQSGQPTGVPQAQRGQNVQDSARATDGFMEHGTGALDAAGDNMYGPLQDGTWTDIMQTPGGAVEVPRQP